MNGRQASGLRTVLLASVFYAGVGLTVAAAQPKTPGQQPAPENGAQATQTVRTVSGDITDQQRLQADKDTDNWLLYGRTYDNQRFSPLKDINADNAGKLQMRRDIYNLDKGTILRPPVRAQKVGESFRTKDLPSKE